MIMNGFGTGGFGAVNDDSTWFTISTLSISNAVLSSSNFGRSAALTIGSVPIDYNLVKSANKIKVIIDSWSLSGTGAFNTASNTGGTSFYLGMGTSLEDSYSSHIAFLQKSYPAPGNTTAVNMTNAFSYNFQEKIFTITDITRTRRTSMGSSTGLYISEDNIEYAVYGGSNFRYYATENMLNSASSAPFSLRGRQFSDCWVPSGNWYLTVVARLVGHY